MSTARITIGAFSATLAPEGAADAEAGESSPPALARPAAPTSGSSPAPTQTAPSPKTVSPVTPKQARAVKRGEQVRWSTSDLADPEEAKDEEHFYQVPEGAWRVVLSVRSETGKNGKPVTSLEYATSRYNDDFDERDYAPSAVLQTRPPKYQTHRIRSLFKVGDHLKIGDEEWVIESDRLELLE